MALVTASVAQRKKRGPHTLDPGKHKEGPSLQPQSPLPIEEICSVPFVIKGWLVKGLPSHGVFLEGYVYSSNCKEPARRRYEESLTGGSSIWNPSCGGALTWRPAMHPRKKMLG